MLADTLPRLLRRNAASMGARPAMREKRHGIWQTLTWSAYETLVLDLARGLHASGFSAGDRLAVMGDNRPYFYATLLAAQSLGGTGVPVWPDADPGVLAGILRAAKVRVVVAEDQEQISKLVTVRDQLPDLVLAVSLDPRAARYGDTAWLIDFTALKQQGSGVATPVDGIANGRPDDVALLLCRTGQPGIRLSHANLLSAAHAITEVETVHPTDETVCFLPMAWIGDMLYSLTLGLAVGFTCIGLTAYKSRCVKPVEFPHIHDVPQDCQGRFGGQRAKNASVSARQFNHRRHLQGQKNDFNVAVYGPLKSGRRIL